MRRKDIKEIARLIHENKNDTWRLACQLADYFEETKNFKSPFDRQDFISIIVNGR